MAEEKKFMMHKIKTRKITRTLWRRLTGQQRRKIRWKAQSILDEERVRRVSKTDNHNLPYTIASWKHIKKLLGA